MASQKKKKSDTKKSGTKPVPSKKTVPAKKAIPVKKPMPAKKPVAKKTAGKKPSPAKKPTAPAKKVTIVKKTQSSKVPAKKPTAPKPQSKKSTSKIKKTSTPVKSVKKASAPAKKATPPAKKTAPVKKVVSAKKTKAPVKAPVKKAPVKKAEPKNVAKSKKASVTKKSQQGKPDTSNALPEIVVRRDAETVQTKVITHRRGLLAYTPKELELLFLRRGAANINMFNPASTEKSTGMPTFATKQILKELPKSKPRKVGAVSLDDLFGYNPFEKNSVSIEEKQIPAKWIKYYKKLVTLKATIQKDIDEHSQAAFSREGKDDSGSISASYSQHTADIDNEAFTRDCALSLLASKQQELAEINIAIERMKKGTYGVCEITGKAIPAERLRDVPFTRYSIDGKIEAEKLRDAAARRRRAAAASDIASVTDIENDVPIVFNEDDEADRKKPISDPSSDDDDK